MDTVIVVPVDETGQSERALPVAVALATASGARIELVTVDDPHSDAEEMTYYHQRLIEGLPTSVQAHGTLALGDEPVADQLVDVCSRHAGALLCMAATGRGAMGELLAGSVAADVIRQSAHPVLLVGPRVSSGPAEAILTGPVVAGLDGSELDTAVISAAARLAKPLGTTVRLVHVLADPTVTGTRAEAERMTDDARRMLAEFGVGSSAVLAPGEDPAPLLLELVSDANGALVVGSHRRGPLGRLAFASTAMWLVHRAPCPLLVVPSAATASTTPSPTDQDKAIALGPTTPPVATRPTPSH